MAKGKPAGAEMLELDYNLAELPSSQHRAGLAGLVLMVEWLRRRGTNKGICELTRLDERGATLRIDLSGLEALFDEVYGASSVEREYPERRDKPPLGVVKRKVTKRGKTAEQEFYIYLVIVPKGAFLADYDPSANGQDGVWVNLWRAMLFKIFRGRDKQRIPFKARAEGKPTKDVSDTWVALNDTSNPPVKMPSTFYLGAQEKNAEDVPFKDRARFQFLLHFWLYVAQVYVPAVIDNEGKRKYRPYALAIPDVAKLKSFCDVLPRALRQRETKAVGSIPIDCIVDLAIESALDLMGRLHERLVVLEGERETSFLVLGVDVIHAEKPENDTKLLSVSRLDPELTMVDEYATLRRTLWNPLFRRQRMINLMAQRPWYDGLDALLCRLPFKELFAEQEAGFKYFRHDVRQAFEQEFNVKNEEAQTDMTTPEEPAEDRQPEFAAPPDASCEALVYRVVSEYIRRKLALKYDDKYNPKASQEEQDLRKERRGKVARDAFLAVRSRTGADFVDFFATTLCSVPQFLSEEQFMTLARDLYEDTDKVRTLTLLALSARS